MPNSDIPKATAPTAQDKDWDEGDP